MVKDILSYDKVFSALMTLSEYHSQRMSEYKVKVKDKSKLLTDMNDLVALDFSNTLNYSVLSNVKEEIAVAESESGVIDMYHEIRKAFPSCLILPVLDFYKVLKDNDLVIRPSSFFIGSIPVDTLEKIKAHVSTALSWSYRSNINRGLRYFDRPFRYGRITLFRHEFNLFLKELDRGGGIESQPRELFSKVMRREGYSTDSMSKVWRFISRNTSFNTASAGFNNIFIACPRSMSSPIYERDDSVYDLKRDQERLRKAQAMDPIAFQYTSAGVLVIDSWGKESHNQVLMEHKDKLGLNEEV